VGGWVCAQALACACARVALTIQQETRRHIVICFLHVSTMFFEIINGTIFGKNYITKNVFLFSLQHLFEIFLILRRI
jgi:hypothetical protein